MDIKLFDSHSHLYMAQFDADRGATLARMQEQGVGSVIIGTNLAESKQALALAQQHDFLWSSVGLHPNEAEEFNVAAYEELARDPKVVAIGECGLDYYRSDGKDQIPKFKSQIELATQLNKALVIHCRNAHDDMLKILAEYRASLAGPVVMHFFTGPAQLASQYLDLGCYLSFPGPITYTTEYDDSVRLCPLDKLLAETDSPFAAPVPNRGKRNEPGFVADVVAKIAAVKGLPVSEVAAATVANAQRVFSLQK